MITLHHLMGIGEQDHRKICELSMMGEKSLCGDGAGAVGRENKKLPGGAPYWS
jgi:hypothetical protein